VETTGQAHATFDPSHLRDLRDATSLPGVVGWQTFEAHAMDDTTIAKLNDAVSASSVQFVEVETDDDTVYLLLVNETFFTTPDPKIPTWYSDTLEH